MSPRAGRSARKAVTRPVRLDTEPRRSRAALAAAIGAGLLLLVLVVVPPVLRSTEGATSEAAYAGILLLAIAAVPVGAVLLVLAVIGLVRSRGTPRVGAVLLVVDGAVQLVYGLVESSSLIIDDLRDSVLMWSWAVLSILVTVVGCVLVLARPRPVGLVKEHRRRSDGP
ncbi:hypothetical protein [uncultured Propionibacterium sp.]|uniref:hypothetical protein n=1 Tax=uncultured Propionibacterium sp. TaxID=218066 RepID=UPI00292F432C|nr:hypothetical protein [uncultured Propionibacterium sp.]